MLDAVTRSGPVVLCFDGSEDARRAIEQAGRLLAPRPAVVLTVWEAARDLTVLDPVGDAVGRLSGIYAELDEAGLRRRATWRSAGRSSPATPDSSRAPA